ncbi:MAG: hypothetical protein JW715_08905, partial [Sedimentisphaerales bacterium]|nr:hypothetical protein [Sedimentisphaerales bacterium]
MNINMLPDLIPLVLLLLVFLAVVLICRRRKNLPVSAPRTNRITRITETIILFSAGLAAFIYFGCFNDGLLLQLDKLRPAFAATHIVLAAIVLVFLLLSVLLSWFGRTSSAAILMTIVFFCYCVILKQAPFSGPGYFMTLIAPQDSWEPVVNYEFEVDGGLEGAEVWVNGVFLGKTPFEMTGREFHKKVPFLSEPPEGYSEKIKNRPEGGWFEFNMVVLEKKESSAGSGIYFLPEFKDYYAKVKFSDEWGRDCTGISGGRGDFYRFNYTVSLRGNFSPTEKLNKTRQECFESLLQKARLADYHLGTDWLDTLDTYGDKGWRDIQKVATDETGFTGILNEWALWKYGIEKNPNREQAGIIFGKICDQADAAGKYSRDGYAGRIVELIYDKLNLEDLVNKYESVIENKTSKNPSESIQVIRHAMELWDKKLDAEDPNTPNIIEQKISPALIAWFSDVETAAVFGGPEVEKYLLRGFQRNDRVSGMELGSDNYVYTMGMHLNKWLYHLSFMDDPAARQFRQTHESQVAELTELIMSSNFNSRKEPPEYLFYDLDLGENSMAHKYWPSYSVHVESSFPDWWWEKLKKRWQYLNRLGPLATEDMYIHSWNISKDLQKSLMGGYLLQALEVLPGDKNIPVTKKIIEELQNIADRKRENLGLDKNARHYFQEDECVDTAREYLVRAGDRESLQFLLSKHGQGQNDFAIR